MMRVCLVCGLGLLLVSPTIARVFKDPLGRELEAEIEDVDGEIVVLKNAKGREVRSRMDSFSQADQDYIAQWMKENGVLASRDILLRATESKGTKPARYDLEIVNNEKAALAKISLQSIAYVMKPGEPEAMPVYDSKELDEILPGRRAQVSTREILSGQSWGKQGDRVEGIWLRLFVGEALIAEQKVERKKGALGEKKWEDGVTQSRSTVIAGNHEGGLRGGGFVEFTVPETGATVPKYFKVTGSTQGVRPGFRCILFHKLTDNNGSWVGTAKGPAITSNQDFSMTILINETGVWNLTLWAVKEQNVDDVLGFMAARKAGRKPTYDPQWMKGAINLGAISVVRE